MVKALLAKTIGIPNKTSIFLKMFMDFKMCPLSGWWKVSTYRGSFIYSRTCLGWPSLWAKQSSQEWLVVTQERLFYNVRSLFWARFGRWGWGGGRRRALIVQERFHCRLNYRYTPVVHAKGVPAWQAVHIVGSLTVCPSYSNVWQVA